MTRTHHLINLCGVVLLNIAQDPDIVIPYEVDGHTLNWQSKGLHSSHHQCPAKGNIYCYPACLKARDAYLTTEAT